MIVTLNDHPTAPIVAESSVIPLDDRKFVRLQFRQGDSVVSMELPGKMAAVADMIAGAFNAHRNAEPGVSALEQATTRTPIEPSGINPAVYGRLMSEWSNNPPKTDRVSQFDANFSDNLLPPDDADGAR
jgi:hypothetical protein